MSTLTRWQRIRLWLRPPRTLTITRAGRTYLVLVFGIGFGALNTGNNLLYLVLGMMLSVIVLSGVLSERVLRGIEVRRIGAEDAFAQEPFAFRWSLRADRFAYGLELSEADAEVEGVGYLAFCPPGEDRVVRGELIAPRRGPLKLSAIKVTTSFPFGLFTKSRLIDAEDELLVFPRRGFACADPLDRSAGRAGDSGNPRRGDGNGDLTGLRPLVEGEDARRVHWLKSAAAGVLLRTEREREEQKSCTLEIDPALSGEPLDRRCAEAAAQTQRLLAQGFEVGLDAGATKLRPGSGPGQHRRILRALAYAGFEQPGAEA